MAEVEIPHPDEVREKAGDPFTRQVALFVAVYAVGLAIASFGGHNTSKEMMLAKQEEANQWNRYQSKSTREALYRNEIMRLEAEQAATGSAFPAYKLALLEQYRREEQRMKDDKRDIEEGGGEYRGRGARYYQHEVELMQRKDPYFDFAEVMFQIAIVLASVAMLARKRWAFYASLVLAAAGVLLTTYGFALGSLIPVGGGSH